MLNNNWDNLIMIIRLNNYENIQWVLFLGISQWITSLKKKNNFKDENLQTS